MLGTYALSAGYYDAYYGQAQKVRTLISRDFDAAYEHFDAAGLADGADAWRSRSATRPPTRWPCTSTTCAPSRSNLAGNAGVSVPFGGWRDGRLPVGVQVIAPALGETDHVPRRVGLRAGLGRARGTASEPGPEPEAP